MAGQYWLGVDLGTTFTAAAIRRDGRTEVVQLGARGASIPSVLLLRDDGELLTGDTARRRAVSEPHRVAAEFKRRVGDPVPVLVGGSPFAAEALVARLLKWVVETVTEREGGRPAGIAVTHPANWGPYKLDLLANAIRTAGIETVTFLSEPAAAARHYAAQARLPDGAVVAVYDLGGGTFDACVLRKEVDGGFTLLGQPEGIERLGGIDLDEAVLGHVQRSTEELFQALDPDDPATRAALSRLRDECTAAKEQLSSDVDATIAVLLPGVPGRDVRITRSEFEDLIRPVLSDTIGCVERSLGNAKVTAADLHAVLLVGGSSRVPLVGQLVATGLGRPVAVDADPKLSVAQGAALTAEAAFAEAAASGAASVAAAAAATAAVTAPVLDAGPSAVEPPATAPPAEPPPPAAAPGPTPGWPAAAAVAAAPPATPPVTDATPVAGGRTRGPLLAVAAVVVLLAAVGGFLVFGGGDDGGDGGEVASGSSTTEAGASDGETTTTEATTEVTLAEGVDPSLPEFIDITTVALEDGVYKTFFETNFDLADEDLDASITDAGARRDHIHWFWGNENRPLAGLNGDPEACNCWLADGGESPAQDPGFFTDEVRGDATLLCALVASGAHEIQDVDGDGAPDPGSGDCVDISGMVEGEAINALGVRADQPEPPPALLVAIGAEEPAFLASCPLVPLAY